MILSFELLLETHTVFIIAPNQKKCSNFARFQLESAKRQHKTCLFWHFSDQNGQNLNFFCRDITISNILHIITNLTEVNR